MKEKFILANGVSGNELQRSLAKYGINSFGVRVVDSLKLAQEALSRSGIVIKKRLINSAEQSAIIYSFLNEISYFKNASYTDAVNLAAAFHTMRSCVVDGDEDTQIEKCLSTGIFIEKNKAIFEAFTRYSNYMYLNNLIDADTFLKLAIDNKASFDAEFMYLEQADLSPIELKLIETVSAGKVQKTDIFNLYNIQNAAISQLKSFKAYGAITELEHIVEDIYKNHNLDECVIACTNTNLYSQLLYSLSLRYKIPVSFGCGISINNSNPAKLLKALVAWDDLGHNGVDSLRNLLTCEALDWDSLCSDLSLQARPDDDFINEISEYAGNLKISLNPHENATRLKKIEEKDDLYDTVTRLANVFEQGIIEFLKKYVLLRENMPIDDVALDSIVEAIEIFEKYNPDKLMREVIPKLANKNICKSLSEEGKIHIIGIDALKTCPRKYVYICGLSAKEFPGFAKENYLLLDSDLQKFEGSIKSEQKIINKINNFDEALSFCQSLSCDICLSYSYYDLAELKEQNASSVLYRLFENLDEIQTINYSDARFSESYGVLQKYISGCEIDYDTSVQNLESKTSLMDRYWSFSAINTYLSCPRKFYLSCILNIPEEKPVDPFEVINAAEFGTLAHKMMEFLGKNKPSKEVFLDACKTTFDNFISKKHALIESKKNTVRQEFVDMMDMAYDYDVAHNCEVKMSESNIFAIHEASGLKLHGFPDRIENDGQKLTVVDFKTGRDIKHVDDDPKTCLQVLIYAYLCEQNNPGQKISQGEFRYLRNSGSVTCQYNSASKDAMDEILKTFADGIKSNNFDRCCSNSCRFCTYSDICLLPGEQDEEKGGAGE